LVHRSSWR